MQLAAVAPAHLDEVVGLQDHVIELEQAEGLLAVQAQLHAVEGEHAVDREVAPEIAQERDVFKAVQPVRVVDHDGVRWSLAEAQEPGKDLPDPRHVGGDLVVAEKLAAFVLARRIADLGRAPAHQHDGLVAGAL